MTDAFPLLKATYGSCTCPVCLDVFKDPVGFHCGHVLCRSCAIRCIQARPRCPLCNQAVPNARHLVPLPQLSLFCVLTREVGLRVRPPLPPPRQQETPPKGNTSVRTAGTAAASASMEERLSADHLLGSSPTAKLSHAPVEGATDPASSSQRRQRLRSPPPPTSASSVSLPSSSVSTSPQQPRLRSARTEEYAARVSDFFLHSTASDTQRLPGEFFAAATATRALSGLADTVTIINTLEGGSRTQPEAREIDDVLTAAPATAAAAAAAASSSATLELLQARLAEEGEEMESTPRLSSPARDAVESRPAEEQQQQQQTVTNLEQQPWWRPWRRGQGVVRCSLLAPQVRLQAATITGATEHAPTSSLFRAKENDRATAVPQSPTEVLRFHRSGCCLLCGLDVVHRATVRQRLQRLLHSSLAQCDAAELAGQTEDTLALLLGPLWGVHCTVDTQASSSTSSATGGALNGRAYTCVDGTRWLSERGWCSGGEKGGGDGNTGGPEAVDAAGPRRPQPRQSSSLLSSHKADLDGQYAVAHHNCLAWAGLLDRYTDTDAEPDLGDKKSGGGRRSSAFAEQVASSYVSTTTTQVLCMTVPLVDPFQLYASHASGRVARWQLLAASLWNRSHTERAASAALLSLAGDAERRVQLGPQNGTVPLSSSSTIPNPVIASASSSAFSSSRTASCCALCKEACPSAGADIFSVGLRTCEGTERGESSCGRQFHFPCALLAGATACLVFGLEDSQNMVRGADDVCACTSGEEVGAKSGHSVDVWCGPCRERHDARQRPHTS